MLVKLTPHLVVNPEHVTTIEAHLDDDNTYRVAIRGHNYFLVYQEGLSEPAAQGHVNALFNKLRSPQAAES